jgi:DNA-binding transcriptional ArsR family regulator
VSRVPDDRCDLLCLELPKAEALRARRLADASARLLADRAKALADPTRLTLAAALADTDELCVCDLAWVAERPENLVSHHLRALRSAGLVSSRRDGKMVMYAVTDQGRSLLTAIAPGAEVAR